MIKSTVVSCTILVGAQCIHEIFYMALQAPLLKYSINPRWLKNTRKLMTMPDASKSYTINNTHTHVEFDTKYL